MEEQLDNSTIQQAISGYDADAIRSGKAFSLLEEADDELTRERIIAGLKARAVAVGIRKGEFDALAKAAKNDIRRKTAEKKKAEEDKKKSWDR